MMVETTKTFNFVSGKIWIFEIPYPQDDSPSRNLEYEKYRKYAFGTYIQGRNELLYKNTTVTRSLDYIYLP